MSVTLDDLRLLLEVSTTGSFSQAAARLGWSQPQVSQRIAALEAALGVVLFARHRRGAKATPACEHYLPAARQALHLLDEGRLALQGAPALPRVTLASLPSLSAVVMGSLLVALAEAPMEIRCETDHSSIVMEWLLTGAVDVGFVLKCPAIAGIQMELLCHSPIIAVAAAAHPLAHARSLQLADIADQRIAPQYWGEECDGLMQQIRRLRTQVQPLHAIQPGSAARELALEHGFITIMPELVVRRDLLAGRLMRLPLVDLPVASWQVMMAYRSGKRWHDAKERVLLAARALAEEWQQPLP